MTRMRRRLAEERGFTMVSIMLGMFVIGLFAVGAWQAAVGDVPAARGDQDRKRAYEAAQSGMEWYAAQLERDPTYWTQCTAVPAVGGELAPVNQKWDGTGGDPRRFRPVVGSDAEYSVELLPAPGETACSTTAPNETMLDGGRLTVRSTGKARDDRRSLIATFKRRSFVDFIYFTQWETLDPLAYASNQAAMQAACDKPRSQRSGCTEIQFADGDAVSGPLHTNDESLLVCGSPDFGRGSDRIEVVGALPGYVQAGGCSGTPDFNGQLVAPAGTLSLPPSNAQLSALAHADYTFSGSTCIEFTGASMNVWTNRTWNGSISGCTGTPSLTRPLPPPNGVIYVRSSGTCSGAYNRNQQYNNPSTCGDVAIRGQYSKSITIGAQNDIIINGNLERQGDNMMGLVANNFVRVYHPGTWSSGSCTGNAAGSLSNPTIDAAILALSHSFVVDNWHCGAPLGELTVNGAIAQKFRGPVGQGGSSGITHGYLKGYNYDDRLKFKEPPNFLDPIIASWSIIRRTEQQPAT